MVHCEKPCGSIDIRNNAESFKLLENCTVIEGHLQILLIDAHASSIDYDDLSFPMLTEVTDYVLFFRAFGLRSLIKLFPNLSVIKGQRLFHDYALVIYEMRDLQEIGLINLTAILKGSVRIERNRNLCFANTINWDLITKTGKDDNYIKV